MRKLVHRYWYFILMISCSKQVPVEEEQIETTQITQRHCAANEVLEAQIAADPALRKRMPHWGLHAKWWETRLPAGKWCYRNTCCGACSILYNPAKYFDAQVQSQIAVWTKILIIPMPTGLSSCWVYRRTNVGIRFVLDQTMSKTRVKAGQPTMLLKQAWRQRSGWSGLQGSLLGYAHRHPATDGVVCLILPWSRALGTYVASSTPTTVGHWLNLRFIWAMPVVETTRVDTLQRMEQTMAVLVKWLYCRYKRNDHELHGLYWWLYVYVYKRPKSMFVVYKERHGQP